MLRYFCSIGLLSLLFLTGCDHAPILDSIAPEAVHSSKNYFDLLRHKQYGQLEDALDPSIKSPEIHSTLTSMDTLIPSGEPVSVKVVSAHVACNAGICDNDIVLEYEYPQNWLLVTVVTRKINNDFSITGFHINPIPESVEQTNRFTLLGRKFTQYLFLLPFIAIPLLSLYVLLLCVQTKLETKKKAAWIAAILIGVFSIDISWTTGEFGFRFFSLHLLSVGFHAIPYGSWILSLSLPVGAIAFPIYRDRLIKSTLQAKIVNKILKDGMRGKVQEEMQQQQTEAQSQPQAQPEKESEIQSKPEPQQEAKLQAEKKPEAESKEEVQKQKPRPQKQAEGQNGAKPKEEPKQEKAKEALNEQPKESEPKKASEVQQENKKGKEEKEDKELCTAPASKEGV